MYHRVENVCIFSNDNIENQPLGDFYRCCVHDYESSVFFLPEDKKTLHIKKQIRQHLLRILIKNI